MVHGKFAARLLAPSVRKRIFGGFAVVLLLLAALAAVAWRGLDAVSDGAARVSQQSAESTASADVALQVSEARALVVQYALTATLDDQKLAQASLVRLDQVIGRSQASSTSADTDLRQLAARYRASVDATIAAVEARRSSIEWMQAAAIELRTIVSATTQGLDRETDPALLAAVAKLADSFGATDGAAARFIASRLPADANAAGTSLQTLRGAIAALTAASTASRRIQRFAKALQEPLDRFAGGLQSVIAADDKLRGVTADRDTASDAALRAAAAQRIAATAAQQDAIATMLAGISSARWLSLVTSASAISLGLLLALLIGRSIARPISQLTAVMGNLAAGMLDVVIPHGTRRDELGEMARAVGVFQDHMQKETQMLQGQAAERQQAEQDKRASLVNMAATVESETQTAINQIGQRTATMAATADEMRASAARTDMSAQGAAASASQALANAQTVASAADQLAASIREIGGQVNHSTNVVGRAVEAGRDTRTTIEALNEKVGRIGLVADMIGDIAAKTNLLALNATIEAARAGDAGKGFAVVASEVKQLASQTARSTEEIGHHIAEVRTATGASVAAVGRIEQTIGEINEISGSIAAAVEQQGAATAEIARNISETATAANAMTTRITEVSAEADQTGRHAAEVQDNIAGLAAAVDDLRHSVIRVVRTSTTEVDRRRAPRYPVDLACRVELADRRTHAGRLIDLSEGGAMVQDGPAMRIDDRGVLHVTGVAVALPFAVRHAENGIAHLAFALDADSTAALQPMLQDLARRRAA